MSVMALSMPTFRPRELPETESREGSAAALSPALRRLALSAVAIAATLVSGRLLVGRFDAPLRDLAVSGAVRHVTPDEVRGALATALDTHLFELDLVALRQAIETLPWVAHAQVSRIWPSRLMVRITEREVLARWGERQALSTEGVVFTPGRQPLPGGLPQLDGAPGREREVMRVYGALVDRLSETPLALAGLSEDARGEWTATTRQGVILKLGRTAPLDQAVRLKDIVLPALAGRLEQVHHIDLRYDNGFAVGWRDPAAHPAPASSSSTVSAAPALTAVSAPGVQP